MLMDKDNPVFVCFNVNVQKMKSKIEHRHILTRRLNFAYIPPRAEEECKAF